MADEQSTIIIRGVNATDDAYAEAVAGSRRMSASLQAEAAKATASSNSFFRDFTRGFVQGAREQINIELDLSRNKKRSAEEGARAHEDAGRRRERATEGVVGANHREDRSVVGLIGRYGALASAAYAARRAVQGFAAEDDNVHRMAARWGETADTMRDLVRKELPALEKATGATVDQMIAAFTSFGTETNKAKDEVTEFLPLLGNMTQYFKGLGGDAAGRLLAGWTNQLKMTRAEAAKALEATVEAGDNGKVAIEELGDASLQAMIKMRSVGMTGADAWSQYLATLSTLRQETSTTTAQAAADFNRLFELSRSKQLSQVFEFDPLAFGNRMKAATQAGVPYMVAFAREMEKYLNVISGDPDKSQLIDEGMQEQIRALIKNQDVLIKKQKEYNEAQGAQDKFNLVLQSQQNLLNQISTAITGVRTELGQLLLIGDGAIAISAIKHVSEGIKNLREQIDAFRDLGSANPFGWIVSGFEAVFSTADKLDKIFTKLIKFVGAYQAGKSKEVLRQMYQELRGDAVDLLPKSKAAPEPEPEQAPAPPPPTEEERLERLRRQYRGGKGVEPPAPAVASPEPEPPPTLTEAERAERLRRQYRGGKGVEPPASAVPPQPQPNQLAPHMVPRSDPEAIIRRQSSQSTEDNTRTVRAASFVEEENTRATRDLTDVIKVALGGSPTAAGGGGYTKLPGRFGGVYVPGSGAGSAPGQVPPMGGSTPGGATPGSPPAFSFPGGAGGGGFFGGKGGALGGDPSSMFSSLFGGGAGGGRQGGGGGGRQQGGGGGGGKAPAAPAAPAGPAPLTPQSVSEAVKKMSPEQYAAVTKGTPLEGMPQEQVSGLVGGMGEPDLKAAIGGLQPDQQKQLQGAVDSGRAAAGGGGGGGPPQTGGGGGNEGQRIAQSKAAFKDQLRKEGVPEGNLEEASNLLAGQGLAESGLKPDTTHDKGTGYGIYGARDPSGSGGRRTAMLDWLKKEGYSKDSLEGQSRYMAKEAMSGKYGPTQKALMGATPENRAQNTQTITRDFERPKGDKDRTNYADRAAGVKAAESPKDQQVAGGPPQEGAGEAGGGGWHEPAEGYPGSQFGDSRFGVGGGRYGHTGVDIKPKVAQQSGQPAYASRPGKVTAINDTGDAATSSITVEHAGGYKSVYAHVGPTKGLKVGQSVSGGQKIAETYPWSGSDSNAGKGMGGPHVHYSLYKDGELVNPSSVMPKLGTNDRNRTGQMMEGGKSFDQQTQQNPTASNTPTTPDTTSGRSRESVKEEVNENTSNAAQRQGVRDPNVPITNPGAAVVPRDTTAPKIEGPGGREKYFSQPAEEEAAPEKSKAPGFMNKKTQLPDAEQKVNLKYDTQSAGYSRTSLERSFDSTTRDMAYNSNADRFDTGIA